MILPFKNDVELKKIPLVTIILIVVNFVIFSICVGYNELGGVINAYGLKPQNVISTPYTLFTHMFIHGSILHVVSNMLFLWVFGSAVEEVCGKTRFISLYIISGLVCAGSYILLSPNAALPAYGASGAIAGMIGAYIMFFPSSRIKSFHPLLWIMIYLFLIVAPALLAGSFYSSSPNPFVSWFSELMSMLCFAVFLMFIAVIMAFILYTKRIFFDYPAPAFVLFWMFLQIFFLFFYASFDIPPVSFLGHISGFFAGLFLINFFAIPKPVSRRKLKDESKGRLIHADIPKSAEEIYRERQKAMYGVAPEPKLPKPLLLRCKKCGKIIKITDVRRPLKIKCLKCGNEGILR